MPIFSIWNSKKVECHHCVNTDGSITLFISKKKPSDKWGLSWQHDKNHPTAKMSVAAMKPDGLFALANALLPEENRIRTEVGKFKGDHIMGVNGKEDYAGIRDELRCSQLVFKYRRHPDLTEVDADTGYIIADTPKFVIGHEDISPAFTWGANGGTGGTGDGWMARNALTTGFATQEFDVEKKPILVTLSNGTQYPLSGEITNGSKTYNGTIKSGELTTYSGRKYFDINFTDGRGVSVDVDSGISYWYNADEWEKDEAVVFFDKDNINEWANREGVLEKVQEFLEEKFGYAPLPVDAVPAPVPQVPSLPSIQNGSVTVRLDDGSEYTLSGAITGSVDTANGTIKFGKTVSYRDHPFMDITFEDGRGVSVDLLDGWCYWYPAHEWCREEAHNHVLKDHIADWVSNQTFVERVYDILGLDEPAVEATPVELPKIDPILAHQKSEDAIADLHKPSCVEKMQMCVGCKTAHQKRAEERKNAQRVTIKQEDEQPKVDICCDPVAPTIKVDPPKPYTDEDELEDLLQSLEELEDELEDLREELDELDEETKEEDCMQVSCSAPAVAEPEVEDPIVKVEEPAKVIEEYFKENKDKIVPPLVLPKQEEDDTATKKCCGCFSVKVRVEKKVEIAKPPSEDEWHDKLADFFGVGSEDEAEKKPEIEVEDSGEECDPLGCGTTEKKQPLPKVKAQPQVESIFKEIKKPEVKKPKPEDSYADCDPFGCAAPAKTDKQEIPAVKVKEAKQPKVEVEPVPKEAPKPAAPKPKPKAKSKGFPLCCCKEPVVQEEPEPVEEDEAWHEQVADYLGWGSDSCSEHDDLKESDAECDPLGYCAAPAQPDKKEVKAPKVKVEKKPKVVAPVVESAPKEIKKPAPKEAPKPATPKPKPKPKAKSRGFPFCCLKEPAVLDEPTPIEPEEDDAWHEQVADWVWGSEDTPKSGTAPEFDWEDSEPECDLGCGAPTQPDKKELKPLPLTGVDGAGIPPRVKVPKPVVVETSAAKDPAKPPAPKEVTPPKLEFEEKTVTSCFCFHKKVKVPKKVEPPVVEESSWIPDFWEAEEPKKKEDSLPTIASDQWATCGMGALDWKDSNKDSSTIQSEECKCEDETNRSAYATCNVGVCACGIALGWSEPWEVRMRAGRNAYFEEKLVFDKK